MRRYKVLIHHKGGTFSVLDLDVPARSKGGIQSTENGLKLFEEICAPPGQDTPAAIVLLPADAKCGVSPTRVMKLAARLMHRSTANKKRRAGRKPQPSKAAPNTETLPSASTSTPAKPRSPIPFTGGELVVYHDHVELDGVIVLTDQGTGLMRQILLVLKARQDGSIMESLSVQKLAARTDPDGDVAKAILQFRDTVTREMAKERGVECGRMSVIESGRHGYRFAKGVTARLIADEAPRETREARGEAPHEARDPRHEAPQGSPGEPSLNERRKWIVAEYQAGRRPSNKDIQKANRCSRATAARDLKALKSLGLLRDGHKRQPQGAHAQVSPP